MDRQFYLPVAQAIVNEEMNGYVRPSFTFNKSQTDAFSEIEADIKVDNGASEYAASWESMRAELAQLKAASGGERTDDTDFVILNGKQSDASDLYKSNEQLLAEAVEVTKIKAQQAREKREAQEKVSTPEVKSVDAPAVAVVKDNTDTSVDVTVTEYKNDMRKVTGYNVNSPVVLVDQQSKAIKYDLRKNSIEEKVVNCFVTVNERITLFSKGKAAKVAEAKIAAVHVIWLYMKDNGLIRDKQPKQYCPVCDCLVDPVGHESRCVTMRGHDKEKKKQLVFAGIKKFTNGCDRMANSYSSTNHMQLRTLFLQRIYQQEIVDAFTGVTNLPMNKGDFFGLMMSINLDFMKFAFSYALDGFREK